MTDGSRAEHGVAVVSGLGRAVLGIVFLLSGATALSLQVTWQRVMALHNGVDLSSSTVVVAAFLGGLGLGNLLGGWVADRLGPRRALVALGGANLGIAACAAMSTWVLYDLYQGVATSLSSPVVGFGFTALVVVVPTTLMGTSLPLVARAVTGSVADAGAVVGRFNGLNTVGAAIGAGVATWFVVGRIGLVATTRRVALVELALGAAVLALAFGPAIAAQLQRTAPAGWLGIARRVDGVAPRARRQVGVLLAAIALVGLAVGVLGAILGRPAPPPWSPPVAAAMALAGVGLVVVGGIVAGRRPERRRPGVTAAAVGVALGALAVGWYGLLRLDSVRYWPPGTGRWGFVLALAAAVVVAALWGLAALARRSSEAEGGRVDPARDPAPPEVPMATVVGPADDGSASAAPVRWAWYLAYAGTGAVAVAFEQVMFRLVDGVMRSNSYTFGHVLALYLLLLGLGGLVGSALVRRARDRRRWFLWMQFGVGLSATVSLLVLQRVLPHTALGDRLSAWYVTDGFANGQPPGDDVALFAVGIPVLLMAAPVLLMGASFPFVQAIVTRDIGLLGRDTGRLVFANLVGNVVGAVVGGFVLIDRLGVAGSYVVLASLLGVAGVAGAARLRPRWRAPVAVVALGVLALAVTALPSNTELWAELNGHPAAAAIVREDRACASVLKDFGANGTQLTLNGASQNGYPFDDFHVMIGLLPALAQPDPERAVAVGFGIGSTSYGMLSSGRVGSVTSVELCGGNYEIAAELAARGAPEMVRLETDPVHHPTVGDGRRFLLTDEGGLDIIVPDHSRPTSAGAGNLFSQEFYELMRDRLADDGLAASWIPTYRVQNAITTTFPYAVEITIASYNGSRFFVGSRSPFTLDPEVLVERFDRIAEAYPEPQRTRLRDALADLDPVCLTDGELAPEPAPEAENTDLFPRDESFLDHGGASEQDAPTTC